MAEQQPILGVEIAGWGSALPSRSLSNDELIAEYDIDSNDEWIQERSGIKSRHIISGDESTLTLAVAAADEALRMSGMGAPYQVDRTILATTTSVYRVPGTHQDIGVLLPITGGYSREEASSKEVQTACTGFVTALIEGYRGFPNDGDELDLIIGSDALSTIVDTSDRSTAILFADGAGAVTLWRNDARKETGLLGWYEETDGSARPALYCGNRDGEYVKMNGREVFDRATRVMVKAGKTAMERAGVTQEEINLVIPHQANSRIIDYARRKLGISEDKVVVTIDHHGNTSSGSIPLALAEAVNDGRIKRGEKMLLVGFGAGMTAAAAVIEW
jgi:3-oxoacyl-[acyl-carrier-protein] synthase III